MGRPRLFKSVEDFDAKVQEFRKSCSNHKEPVTWTGLCLYMGFSSRQSLDEYLKYPEFSDSVKKAKMFVEYEYEKKLHGGNSTGAIFALKNFNWSDKLEIKEESTQTVKSLNVEFVKPDET